MDPKFITSFIQDGRKKPAKFKHYIKMPSSLFVEMTEAKVIEPERYYIDGVAFFECAGGEVTINFLNLWQSEDLYARATNYLLIKIMGANPVMRGGIFKL